LAGVSRSLRLEDRNAWLPVSSTYIFIGFGLAICTDGVLEAANAAGEEFGEDGLINAL
jgi:serine phosphatase RsbU (regulator of sigma subunit)